MKFRFLFLRLVLASASLVVQRLVRLLCCLLRLLSSGNWFSRTIGPGSRLLCSLVCEGMDFPVTSACLLYNCSDHFWVLLLPASFVGLSGTQLVGITCIFQES